MKKGTYVATEASKKRMSKAAKKAWEKRRAKAAERNKKLLSDLSVATPNLVKDMKEKYSSTGVETFGFSSKALSSEPNWKMIALELMKKYQ